VSPGAASRRARPFGSYALFGALWVCLVRRRTSRRARQMARGSSPLSR
jgi:hypothetical protein